MRDDGDERESNLTSENTLKNKNNKKRLERERKRDSRVEDGDERERKEAN